MLKCFFLLLLTISLFANFSISQVWEDLWVGEGTGRNEGVALAHTAGGAVFGGNYREQFEYDGILLPSNGNFQQGFLAKANPDGSLVWMHKIKASNSVFTETIAVYNDIIAFGGVYVDTLFIGPDTLINEGQKGIFVALYDTFGNYLKVIHPDVNSAMIFDLHFDKEGDLLITGDFFRWFNFGEFSFDSPEGMNIYIAKYNIQLEQLEWMKVSEGNGNYGTSIDTDEQGNVYLTGSYGINTIFLNQQLPNNNGNHNLFCTKLSQEGEFQWIKTIKGEGQVHGNAIKFGKDNQVFFTGDFELAIDSLNETKLYAQGYTNAFIGSYDSHSGDLKWIQRVGGDDNDKGVKIEVDSIGNPIVLMESGMMADVGGIELPPNGFYEPLILKLDKNNGSYVWHTRLNSISGVGNVGATDFSISNRELAVVGINRNGISFKDNNFSAPNNSDFYLALFRDTSSFEDETIGLETFLSSKLSVYPNPSTGKLNFISESASIDSIRIFSLQGKALMEYYPEADNFTLELPAQEGYYIVHVLQHKTTQIFKVIKL